MSLAVLGASLLYMSIFTPFLLSVTPVKPLSLCEPISLLVNALISTTSGVLEYKVPCFTHWCLRGLAAYTMVG